jgi:6-phosphogluconolactonase
MSGSTIDYGKRGQVVVLPDPGTLAKAAAEVVRDTARDAVTNRGSAFIALSGGSTPKAMGAVLASPPMREEVPWGSLHIFWGDERWVPLEDPESNAGEAIRGYLDALPINRKQIHPYLTTGEPEMAAAVYEEAIRSVVPGRPLPMFDLILLGMGDDAHTASLFPETAALGETSRLVVENYVEKRDTTRLTFTAPLINAARTVAFMVTGAEKAAPLSAVLDGDPNPEQLPAQLIRPNHGDLIWLVDEAAAANLNRKTA